MNVLCKEMVPNLWQNDISDGAAAVLSDFSKKNGWGSVFSTCAKGEDPFKDATTLSWFV